MMSMDIKDFLFELGTEELPPKALKKLSAALEAELRKGLNLIFGDSAKALLATTGFQSYATPRRLAVLIEGLPTHVPGKSTLVVGPPESICYDKEGVATKALQGFAKKNGVQLDDVGLKIESGKITYLKEVPEQSISPLLPAAIQTALDNLPIPKRMRWGANRIEFVRPVHSCVMLFGAEVIDADILGVKSGRHTFGHRFHDDRAIMLNAPVDYEVTLEQGYVIADFAKRRARIERQIEQAASAIDAQAVIDPELLDEVTGLVEWPVALSGRFDARFLDVPAEALISSMKEHQKYFHVLDSNGKILPYFITVANIESRDPQQVIAGNERVIRPRLADAAFFFETDKNSSLESRIEKLKPIIFQAELGTVYQKSQRVAALAQVIAAQIDGNVDWAERASQLAKTDLVTEMVLEFTDLQGLMGSYYALNDGEPAEVAQAINEQYLPKFAGDDLPQSKTGIALALADRIDTLVGLFGIKQPPTGSRDPFALRRATLGTLRILVEHQLDLDLLELITAAADLHTDLPARAGLEQQVLAFMLERFRAWYADQGVPAEVFLAVMAVRPTKPLVFDQRVKAVNHFRSLPQAEALAAANKRVANILAKQGDAGNLAPSEVLFKEAAERTLNRELNSLNATIDSLLAQGDFKAILEQLASLQPCIDAFFDDVMVMVDDAAIRDNRIRLLNQLRQRFLLVADISLL
ncbi:MAG: glycyl-tRNA synthetase beta chain [Motiliproteus sp.]|jgi:glycyl-tRNA synthetase beta chain